MSRASRIPNITHDKLRGSAADYPRLACLHRQRATSLDDQAATFAPRDSSKCAYHLRQITVPLAIKMSLGEAHRLLGGPKTHHTSSYAVRPSILLGADGAGVLTPVRLIF